MVTTRRSKAGTEADGTEVVAAVEVGGNVPQEIAEQVAEETADQITSAADAVPEIAAEPEAAVLENGSAPAVVDQTTTVTEDTPGEVVVETTETAEQPTAIAEEPAATTVTIEEEGEPVPDETIEEAVKEAVEAAEATAAATGEPAVAQTTIELAPPNGLEAEGADLATAPTLTPASETKPAVTHRLFVGCVPHQFKEEDLRPYFEEVAKVKEVTILRDQLTGSSRGCAFAIFEEKADADLAIDKLDKKFTLPGSGQPIEVRYARESNKIQPSAEPNEKNQIFFARAPPSSTEQDVRNVFAEFGEITEVALFMNRAAGVSKGCGFVYFKEKDQAQAAIEALHDKRTMPGGFTTLTVKWADPNLNEKKRKAAEDAMDPNKDNTQIFYARIPKVIPEDDIRKVFETVGNVKDVVLFKTHQSATVNKGCGIVTMETHEEAVQALEQLDNVHTFEGMDVAMVLKWVDQDLQKRRRMEREPGSFGPPGGPWQGGPQFGGPPPMGTPGGPMGPPGAFAEEERPPAGCDRDAFKLYLAGIPKTWELPDLRQVMEKYGQIVDMNLVRDKVTKEPKGVAFMWFRSRVQAENAIRELNHQSFDDGYGGKRTIQISKAKPRRNPMAGGLGPAATPPGGPGGFGRSPGFQAPYGQPRPPVQPPYQQQPQYYQQPPAYDPYGGPPQQQPPQQPAYASYQGGYQQQAAPSYGYPQPQAHAAPAYQQPQQQPSVGYQQAYNPTASYGAPSASAASYGSQTGYDTQTPQQPQYGAPQYGAASAVPQQPGYNYSAAGTGQGTYAAPAAPTAAAPAAGQYSYSAPAAGGYADPNAGGYNYGGPSS